MKVCGIPAIFVDENLMIRSFTQESRQIYRLSREDIGRSLLDVACGLNYHSLSDDFQRVVETRKSINRYLKQSDCEVPYFLRILPNFCRDNSFSGASLIFTRVEEVLDWGIA